jgi:hypothetical protein
LGPLAEGGPGVEQAGLLPAPGEPGAAPDRKAGRAITQMKAQVLVQEQEDPILGLGVWALMGPAVVGGRPVALSTLALTVLALTVLAAVVGATPRAAAAVRAGARVPTAEPVRFAFLSHNFSP